MDIEIKFYMAILFAAWYMSVGLAIYIIFFIKDALSGFKLLSRATPISILRGGLVIFAWPCLPWWIA